MYAHYFVVLCFLVFISPGHNGFKSSVYPYSSELPQQQQSISLVDNFSKTAQILQTFKFICFKMLYWQRFYQRLVLVTPIPFLTSQEFVIATWFTSAFNIAQCTKMHFTPPPPPPPSNNTHFSISLKCWQSYSSTKTDILIQLWTGKGSRKT